MAEQNWESLSHQEKELLQPFVTNLDESIFGLRNLPEVVKGALFSRYSRSEKSLRRILLDEFINAPEANFSEMVGVTNSGNQIIATELAEAFYDRVLIGYGDDSVAELGGAHLGCEGISNIAAKALEDSRLGISPLEKSTRYVRFDRKINGRYSYCRESSIVSSKYAQLYENTLDHLFDTYSNLIEPLLDWVRQGTPKDETTGNRAYNNATRAKTLDLLRGLLPMATLTNVGLFGNGRAFEYLLVKLAASPHQEVQKIGEMMQSQLDKMIPSFVKRAKSERGRQYSNYLQDNYHRTGLLTPKLLKPVEAINKDTVKLIEYDRGAEDKIIAAILYPHTDLTLEQIQEAVENLSAAEKREIIDTYIGERLSRFHKPGRALEETYYTFDILADIGAYRDLHRHRVMTQERQLYTVRHGYDTPIELIEANLHQGYKSALNQAAETTETIGQELPFAAQYVVPFAYKIRWRIKLNLREIYHLVELRSAKQGHPSYRFIAQEMYRQIKKVHPNLVQKMSFVDLKDYSLERLAAEQRLEEKSRKH
ncbi:MAG: Flavin-dependent thymidylate synthase [Chroococcopsis gigantea SAG 12.99]|jgi:thymidylate synthase ThyX|nr:FAD-dependent thymidylate synthase [Chlorogloea purpurea SAG 13.99]MDV2998488.1 Flavin-dependent thymidylate synthase [Chroococcopsis gigantea SAG 12.99]